MNKTIIRVRKKSPHNKIFLLADEQEIEIQHPVEKLVICGWFITRITKKINKTNLLLSTYMTDYILRSDEVKTKCFLSNTKNFTCGACRKIYIK